MSIFRIILGHVCVVCSLVCITAKILDWYNPFMNFSGQLNYIQILLYLAVPVMVFSRLNKNNRVIRK